MVSSLITEFIVSKFDKEIAILLVFLIEHGVCFTKFDEEIAMFNEGRPFVEYGHFFFQHGAFVR